MLGAPSHPGARSLGPTVRAPIPLKKGGWAPRRKGKGDGTGGRGREQSVMGSDGEPGKEKLEV